MSGIARSSVIVTTNRDKTAYGGTVKGIQHGTISFGTNETTHASTISAVDTSKSIILPLGGEFVPPTGEIPFCRLEFGSSTLVTGNRNLNGSSTATAMTFGYTVVEFY